MPNPVPDTGGGQSGLGPALELTSSGGDPKANLSGTVMEGSTGGLQEGGVRGSVYLKAVTEFPLGGSLESPFPSIASSPASPLQACSAGITTSRQPPLISSLTSYCHGCAHTETHSKVAPQGPCLWAGNFSD